MDSVELYDYEEIVNLEEMESEEVEFSDMSELSFGSSRTYETIEKELNDTKSKYERASQRYEELRNDKANGWIGVDSAISDRRSQMSIYSSKIKEVERELKSAKKK